MSTPDPHPLQTALGPLLERIGGSVIPLGEAVSADVVLQWDGADALAIRLPPGLASLAHFTGRDRGSVAGSPSLEPAPRVESPADGGGLEELIETVAAELGSPLTSLPRAEKQRAVRLLEERGAFSYRRSAETIAEALGVSRFTVYNYLNRDRSA